MHLVILVVPLAYQWVSCSWYGAKWCQELEEEVERSEVMGEEVAKDMVGTQASEMEMDDMGG